MMTSRFCRICDAEVQDAGGYCLLGHSLAVPSGISSLDELRAEVDRTFEEARLQVAAIGEAPVLAAPPIADPRVPIRPLNPPFAIEEATTVADSPVPIRPLNPAPAPPAPPPAAPTGPWAALSQEIERAAVVGAEDPIAAFAPAPRMDWGPERDWRPKPSRLRRPSRSPA
jgi:hypothetical protein